jgi:pimeloyl-ACP methyl ester carboxylesterase
MGGLIGMLLAAQSGVPIRRLVMNDVGAFIPKAALERIGTYVGKDPIFADVAAIEAYLRRVAAPFGPLTDAQWRHLAEHGGRVAADGTLRLAYDPRIAVAFSGGVADVDLRAVWERVRCDVLITRGAESDLLTREIAEAMLARAGRTQLVDFAGIGHAPTFMAIDQIAAVSDFLFAD